MIVWVNVVLNRIVVVDSDRRSDNQCDSHLQSQSELYHGKLWYLTLASHNVISLLSKGGVRGVRISQNHTQLHIDPTQNNIRKLQTSLKLPKNF